MLIIGLLIIILGIACNECTLGLLFSPDASISSPFFRIIILSFNFSCILTGIWIIQRKNHIAKRILLLNLMLFLILSATFSIYYVGRIVYRGNKLYSAVKSRSRGWRGKVHQGDTGLGFRPIPNSKGYQIFSIGNDIPMRYDNFGFRIPAGKDSADYQKRPLLLFLGDSFTYGATCLAEETFPYLTAEYLNGTPINAGCCSYGLSQMVILARKLIPEYKPNYVVVQYSPWLMYRAINIYAPSIFGTLPAPYIALINGKNRILPPPFLTAILELPVEQYENSPKSIYDYISFLKDVAIPLYIYDDFHIASVTIKLWLKIIPMPNRDRLDVERYAYTEIYQLCKDNNCKMVLFLFGGTGGSVKDHYAHAIEKLQDVIIVDSDSALWGRLARQDMQEFSRNYHHWRGSPPVLVDEHINPKAHKIIANEIHKKIAEQKLPR